MSQLAEKYFVSAPADRGRLLAGQGFSDFDQPAKAREVFAQFARERTNSPLLPEVVFAAARTFAREQRWPEAITNYEVWLNAYPTNDLRPRVEYARNWATAQSGDEARRSRCSQILSANTRRMPSSRRWRGGGWQAIISNKAFSSPPRSIISSERLFSHACAGVSRPVDGGPVGDGAV